MTTHEQQLNYNGWAGEGCIILDPNTGAGAYKIAGGGNGSKTKFTWEKTQFNLGVLNKAGDLIARKLAGPIFALYDAYNTMLSVVAVYDRCQHSTGFFLIMTMVFVMIFFAALLPIASMATAGVGMMFVAALLTELVNWGLSQITKALINERC